MCPNHDCLRFADANELRPIPCGGYISVDLAWASRIEWPDGQPLALIVRLALIAVSKPVADWAACGIISIRGSYSEQSTYFVANLNEQIVLRSDQTRGGPRPSDQDHALVR